MTDRGPWLVDNSALTRLGTSRKAEAWAERITRGEVHLAAVTQLEVGFPARTASDHVALFSQPPMTRMPVEHSTPAIEDRALAVQGRLAERGQHRTPSVPDLLIAATAELRALTVLHDDKDFELIAAVTGQPTQRLV